MRCHLLLVLITQLAMLPVVPLLELPQVLPLLAPLENRARAGGLQLLPVLLRQIAALFSMAALRVALELDRALVAKRQPTCSLLMMTDLSKGG